MVIWGGGLSGGCSGKCSVTRSQQKDTSRYSLQQMCRFIAASHTSACGHTSTSPRNIGMDTRKEGMKQGRIQRWTDRQMDGNPYSAAMPHMQAVTEEVHPGSGTWGGQHGAIKPNGPQVSGKGEAGTPADRHAQGGLLKRTLWMARHLSSPEACVEA